MFMEIMVTGASGGYGQYAIDYIKRFDNEVELYGLVRNKVDEVKLKSKGVNVRVGDYANKDSLIEAFKGINRLLFVSVPIYELQINVVEAAKEAGVRYIAYTSIADPEYPKFGLEINHRETEKLIRKSGIKHTFLRNNWYLEIIAPYLKVANETNNFFYYAKDNKVSWALKREYAEAGAKVILKESEKEIITLSRNGITFRELGEKLRENNDSLRIKGISKEEWLKSVENTDISDIGRKTAVLYQDYALSGNNGEDKLSSKEFEEVLGHALTPMNKAIKEVINASKY